MIQVIKTGRTPTMRHLHLVHRVAVAWLHERLGPGPERDNISAEYTKLDETCADLYTKHIVDGDKWKKLIKMVNIIDPRAMRVRERPKGTKVTLRRAAAAKELGNGAGLIHCPVIVSQTPSFSLVYRNYYGRVGTHSRNWQFAKTWPESTQWLHKLPHCCVQQALAMPRSRGVMPCPPGHGSSPRACSSH